MSVRFVDIGGIVDHHSLNFLFVIVWKKSMCRPAKLKLLSLEKPMFRLAKLKLLVQRITMCRLAKLKLLVWKNPHLDWQN